MKKPPRPLATRFAVAWETGEYREIPAIVRPGTFLTPEAAIRSAIRNARHDRQNAAQALYRCKVREEELEKLLVAWQGLPQVVKPPRQAP